MPVGISDIVIAVAIANNTRLSHAPRVAGDGRVRRILARRKRRHRSRIRHHPTSRSTHCRCIRSSCTAKVNAPVGIPDTVTVVIDDTTRLHVPRKVVKGRIRRS